MLLKSKTIATLLATVCFGTTSFNIFATETVRIASLDMLSGGLAGFGHSALKHWQFLAEKANKEQWAGDVQFEIIPFDTKMSPQEALVQLRQVQDKGIRYVVQGASSSAVGLALQEAIARYNDRNPGKEIVYLNYAAAAPAMTGEKCNYWHFRTDAHVNMKIGAMAQHMAADENIKKVYLLNPNYAYGQDAARAAREFLQKARPGIEIVGDDYHPTGQVKDFSPYIAKIMQSKADALMTVSFGNDLALMVRAANDMGMQNTRIYTLSGNSQGMGAVFGAASVERVMLTGAYNMNDDRWGATGVAQEYHQKMGEDYFFGAADGAMRLLTAGIRKAGSTDPAKVAASMSGLAFDSLVGPVVMRAQDHQLDMPIYIDTWGKMDGATVKLDQDGSGFGWRMVHVAPREQTAMPTVCQMKRP